jgi:PAS domain S-box-containing protein
MSPRKTASPLPRRIAPDLRDEPVDVMDHEFFDSAPVPLHSVRSDGVILRANPAELRFLGYTADEYVGHHVSEFHADPAVIEDILACLARGETVRDREARVRCKDGSIKDVLIDSTVLPKGGAFIHARCFTRDISARKYAQDVHARFAAIVDSSADAIVGKTLDGIVTSWNASAERIFGYTAGEMVGQSISRIIPPDCSDDLPTILDAIRRGQRVEHYETERIRKDGRRINVSLTVSPIKDDTGRVIGVSKIARDVTERKRAEAEREELLAATQRARSEAESASRAKDEFLSIVSHELRTPLAAILGWVHVLKKGTTGDRAARAIETIERSGQAQAKLIEDLLDASRIVTGRMRLDLRLLELLPVIRSALDTIRPTADVKGVRVEAYLDPAAGPIAGDADRLQQIAWNLLSNAVKFTPAGGVVTVRLERRDGDVRLLVRDTGCGIAPAFLPFIFERFRQAESAETRRAGGLGLGLAIVRHLAELHGGTVAATSEGEGTGAEFTVTLPLTPLQRDTGGGEGIDIRLLHGLRLLVVDDDSDTQDSLRLILEAHGAQVTIAGTAREARDALHELAFDVLVSDIRLPDDDGYSLARELRASDRLRHMAAIAVSGCDDDEDGRHAFMAGYHVRLSKPVDPELLLAAVTQVTRRFGFERAR